MIVLVIPVAALTLALVWVRWSRKPARPLDDLAQVADYRRRLDALAPAGSRRVEEPADLGPSRP